MERTPRDKNHPPDSAQTFTSQPDIDDRDRKLRLYETVLSTTPDLVCVFDLNLRFTYANDALLTTWGVEWHEAIGRNCLELGYEPRYAEMHDREIEQVIATGQPIRGEAPYWGTSGLRTFDYILVPVFGENNDVEAVAGTARDITDRKQAEADLHRAMDFDEAVMKNMSEGLFTVDSEGRIATMNPAAERLFGIQFDDVRDHNFHDALHYKHPDGTPFPADECDTLRAMTSGKAFSSRHDVFVRGDGTMFDAIFSASPISIGDEVLGTVAVFRDITQEKRIETELKVSEGILERYRLLSEKSRDAIWFLTPDQNFVEVNDAAVELYGYTRDEFLTMNLRDIRHPSTLVQLGSQFAAANSHGVHFETLHIRKDGTPMPVDVQANGADFGSERLIMSIVRDISERKKSEDALRESEERRKLAAGSRSRRYLGMGHRHRENILVGDDVVIL